MDPLRPVRQFFGAQEEHGLDEAGFRGHLFSLRLSHESTPRRTHRKLLNPTRKRRRAENLSPTTTRFAACEGDHHSAPYQPTFHQAVVFFHEQWRKRLAFGS